MASTKQDLCWTGPSPFDNFIVLCDVSPIYYFKIRLNETRTLLKKSTDIQFEYFFNGLTSQSHESMRMK